MTKKGFTLVELLAVIVILAIIAVIAVPIVLNVINKSKKGAAIDSAYSYVDAIEKYIVMHDMDETKYPKNLESGETYQVSNTTYTETSSINLIEKVYAEDSIILNDIISIKGTKPSSGIVTISGKRKVGKAILIIDNYKVICEKGKCNIDGELVSLEEPTPSTEPVETCEYEAGKTWNYEFDPDGDGQGQEQTFEVPCDGTYKIELWGAQGGGFTDQESNSKGAYVSGKIYLIASDNLYLYLGQKGLNINNINQGIIFNGGGNTNSINSTAGATGGGATDIRLISGSWNDDNSLNSRIIVAAAGGGGHDGAVGGGLTGYHGTSTTYYNNQGNGATQTQGGLAPTVLAPSVCAYRSPYPQNGTAGSFGIGGIGGRNAGGTNNGGGSGGGGGYYGGSGSSGLCNGQFYGGSGSSYISGHTGCVAITSSTDRTPKSGCETGTTDNSCSIHYSGLKFTDTVIIDGAGYSWTNDKGEQKQMPNPSGGNYDLGVGHSGNGYARITLISLN